jgi:FixJ family two-component response regulator
MTMAGNPAVNWSHNFDPGALVRHSPSGDQSHSGRIVAPDEATVFVVDDDEQARNSLGALVTCRGVSCQLFASSEEFLAGYQGGRPGCLVADLEPAAMDGLELIKQLQRRGIYLPPILLTASPRIAVIVDAMRCGALTVVDKPYRDDELWDAIRTGLNVDASGLVEHRRRRELVWRLGNLTSAQREFLDRVVQGNLNKVIAAELDIGVRTVEKRRREVLTTMQAGSIAELIRMVIETEPLTNRGHGDPLR